jgi:outer membrane receptor protein involved in Fe transport
MAVAAAANTKLKFNAGLGVKEPTILQSFSPSPSFLGNSDLEPERATTVDAGIEQRLFAQRVKIEASGSMGVTRTSSRPARSASRRFCRSTSTSA